jgi:hypothetical protein
MKLPSDPIHALQMAEAKIYRQDTNLNIVFATSFGQNFGHMEMIIFRIEGKWTGGGEVGASTLTIGRCMRQSLREYLRTVWRK